MLLGGMGELHLEISRDRLVKDFGAKCEMGNVRVSYRETLAENVSSIVEKVYEREINGKLTKFGLTVEVSYLNESKTTKQFQRHKRQFREFGNIIDIDLSHAHGFYGLDETQAFEAICSGTRPVLQTGSTFQLPLHSTLVQISDLVVFSGDCIRTAW